MSGGNKDMNKHSPITPETPQPDVSKDETPKRGSLLERASETYKFDDIMRGQVQGVTPPPLIPADVAKLEARKAAAKAAKEAKAAPQMPTPAPYPVYHAPPVAAPVAAPVAPPQPRATAAERKAAPRLHTKLKLPVQPVDRDLLEQNGFISPGGAVNTIAEEFRLVKRTLLRGMNGAAGQAPIVRGERILIASANPNEGKTFCAVNLALSLAAEEDHEVLLVDADFAKPSVLSTLGLAGREGFMDALANPDIAVEDLIIPTDVKNLSVLPAGNQTVRDAEYLASDRTVEVLDRLTENAPHRIIIFDSPPVLAASPAAVLAQQVGQTVVVVRADKTTENALREAVSLLSGCEHVQLLLNAVKFSTSGRRYGAYYGYGE